MYIIFIKNSIANSIILNFGVDNSIQLNYNKLRS
nr:MAG TPA: hypothetical protein [Caudoviricetes sp.]